MHRPLHTLFLFIASVVAVVSGAVLHRAWAPDAQRVCYLQHAIPFRVLNALPHDETTFTQGLFVDPINSSRLYESSGLRFRSRLQHVELPTGRVLQTARVEPASLFAEGAAYRAFDDAIVVLTLSAGRALTFDRTELRYRFGQDIPYGPSDAWGLAAVHWDHLAACPDALRQWTCSDSEHCLRRDEEPACFLMSNGSSIITVRHPRTLAWLTSFPALHHPCSGEQVSSLNELEVVMRPAANRPERFPELWANIWLSSNIVVMDICAGLERQRHALFVGELNLSVLALERTAQGPSPVHPVHPDAVLNGIAWDANRPRNLYVTGKWWRKLYTLELGLREHVAGHTSRGAARHQRALLRLMRTLLIVAVLVMAVSCLVRVLVRIRHRLADGLTISRTQNDDTSRKLTADVQATRELVARKMASH